jgi:hypothetical protein
VNNKHVVMNKEAVGTYPKVKGKGKAVPLQALRVTGG